MAFMFGTSKGTSVRLMHRRFISKTNNGINVTFFTKETCQLCTNAKEILHKSLAEDSLKDINIKLNTIDIMKPENSKWFDKYCYDVPVLHVEREGQRKPTKFMHYLYEDKLLDEFKKTY